MWIEFRTVLILLLVGVSTFTRASPPSAPSHPLYVPLILTPPDRLAYTRLPDHIGSTIPSIEVANIDGSDIHQLTTASAGETLTHPTWAPLGTQLAFVLQHESSPTSTEAAICIMNADGSNRRVLVRSIIPTTYPMPLLLHDAAWSPDGTQIAYSIYRNGQYAIEVITIDSTHRTQLTDNGYAPTWAPDSRQLAFVSTRDGNAEVYLMTVDGLQQRRLTETAEWEEDLAWSPNRGQIAFTRGQNLYLLNIEDASQQLLLHAEYSYGLSEPAWSPDGTRIAFASGTLHYSGIFLITADGSNQSVLHVPGSVVEPAWMPR